MDFNILINRSILRKIKKYIGYLLTILSFYLLSIIFYENGQAISHLDLNTQTLCIFIFSIIVVLIGHSFLVLSWFIQLTNKYTSLCFKKAFITVGLSQIAKYIPGNVAHLLGRALLINEYVSKKDVALTLLFESLILAVTASFFGYLWGREYILPAELTEIYALFTLIFLIFITISLIEILRKRTAVVFLTYRTFISNFFINSISFFLHGIAIYLIAVHIVNIHSLSLLQCTYGFALSFLIGYILPGASGGIGVREYSFVALFSPYTEEILALQIIILYRLITIVGDILFFLISYGIKNEDKSYI